MVWGREKRDETENIRAVAKNEDGGAAPNQEFETEGP